MYDVSASNYDTELAEEEVHRPKAKPESFKSAHHYIPGFLATKRLLPAQKIFNAPHPPAGYKHLPTFTILKLEGTKSITLIPNNIQFKQALFPLVPLNQVKISDAVLKPETSIPKKTIPKIPQEVAQAALGGFIPFGDNIQKQDRYKQYLNFMAGHIEDIAAAPKTLTREEKAHEPLEFSKAAMIYRPLSKMMASRFTSSAIEHAITKHEPKRKKTSWKPDRITCKRFGVSFIKPQDESAKDDLYEKLAVNTETMNKLLEERDRIMNVEDGLDLVEQEEEIEEIVEVVQRPPMDLFTAIFCDSEDDEKKPEQVEEAFRPVFSKSKTSIAKKEGSKRPGTIKLDSLEEFNDIEVPSRKKLRPTAVDFM